MQDNRDRFFKRGLFRPKMTPDTDIPLGARSVGHYHVKPGHRDNIKTLDFIQIFWGLHGHGALVIDGRERVLGPDQVGIYFPGMHYDVHALDVNWEYRWWTMDGPLSLAIVNGFGIARAGVFDCERAPEKLFSELEAAIQENTPDGERRSSAIAYRLLSCVSIGRLPHNRHDDAIKESIKIIARHWGDPKFNVEKLSDMLRTDRSSFSRGFRAALGIPPSQYIQNIRIQNALTRLKKSTSTVQTIARDCGWSDPAYFARAIKQASGLSPKQFRES